MSVVNRKAMEGTILAHTDGGVPEVLIEVDDLTAYNVGYLIYFFWRACACSGYLLSVNPFNQKAGCRELQEEHVRSAGQAGLREPDRRAGSKVEVSRKQKNDLPPQGVENTGGLNYD